MPTKAAVAPKAAAPRLTAPRLTAPRLTAPRPAAPRLAAPNPASMPASRAAAGVVAAPHPRVAGEPTKAPALPAFARAALAAPKAAAPVAAAPHDAAPAAAATAGAATRAQAAMHAPRVAMAAARPTEAPPKLAPAHRDGPGGGEPLAPHIQEAIERSFHLDIAAIRVHTSPQAQRAARELSARAFAYGTDIFLGSGEHASDLGLLAHEAAHVVQQQTAPSHQRWSSDRGDRFEREADRAADAVTHGERFTVSERVSAPRVQRLGISDALDYFADAAYNIPGYRMFTILLGVNPINMEHVERSAVNFLRAIIEFIPGGKLITQALDKYNVLDRVAGWMQEQVDTLAITGASIKQALYDFLDSLSWRDIFHLGSVWDRAKRIFTEPIERLKDFAKGLLAGIWKFVREAILKPIAALASKTAGWDLLTAVLGTNPITGENVPRTAETLIGGFMKLIHQEEIWHNMQRANAVPRAWAWFQSVISELMGFVKQIPTLFLDVLHSLEWTDIIDLPSGFRKIVVPFGTFLGNFAGWAGDKVWNLLQLIFEVVAPSVIPYLKKVGAAFKGILKNPIGFVRNLIAAGKLGFEHFVKNFATHLKAGLIDWLTGSLPGVYIPKAFTLTEMGLFALSVLGITWAQIRAKIVKALGDNGEKIMSGLEQTFDVVVALVKGGPAAAWELIKEKLTNLKDMVIDGIVSFVTDTIIKKAIPKLIAMFIPGAGFISAIVSIYDTIMVFVQKLAKIAETVKAFVDSIVAIAGGQIEGAAAKVESSLAGLLSLAINFLAGFLGLSGIAKKVMGVIEKVHAIIDKALDTAVGWIVGKAKGLFGAVKAGAAKAVEWWKKKKPFTTDTGVTHEVYFSGNEANPLPMVASKDPRPVVDKLEEFRKAANHKNATKDEKNALTLITTTLAAVKKDPNDEAVVKSLKALFAVFDDEKGPPKFTKLAKPVTQVLGGSTVGIEMSIDWLDAKFPKTHPGSTPGSGQDALMDLLVTDPGNRSAFKYIRGHLLNENLGGEGQPYNLFPITANANSQHLHKAESTVKKWVLGEDPNARTRQWVFYEVKIGSIDKELSYKGRDIAKNHVNCVLSARAVLKNADGEEKESFLATIESTYKEKTQGTVFNVPK